VPEGATEGDADGAADGATEGATEGAATLGAAGEVAELGAADGTIGGAAGGARLGDAVADGVQAAIATARETDSAAVAITRFIRTSDGEPAISFSRRNFLIDPSSPGPRMPLALERGPKAQGWPPQGGSGTSDAGQR
jgi:hypothetical protein